MKCLNHLKEGQNGIISDKSNPIANVKGGAHHRSTYCEDLRRLADQCQVESAELVMFDVAECIAASVRCIFGLAVNLFYIIL